MKAVKIIVILALVYVGIVVAFESLIGTLQPTQETTVLLTTFDEAGKPHERVVSRVDSGGQLYVSANHWPRAWYERALAKPEVQVTIDGQKADYLAVPVSEADGERIDAEQPHPALFRFLTGYAPRKFVRLDPR